MSKIINKKAKRTKKRSKKLTEKTGFLSVFVVDDPIQVDELMFTFLLFVNGAVDDAEKKTNISTYS